MQRGRPKKIPPAAGNRIFELRSRSGLTQERLAELCGYTPGFIQKLESGKREITQRTLFLLAKALRCAPGEIFGAPPPAHPDPQVLQAMRIAEAMTPEERAPWLEVGSMAVRARISAGTKKTGS